MNRIVNVVLEVSQVPRLALTSLTPLNLTQKNQKNEAKVNFQFKNNKKNPNNSWQFQQQVLTEIRELFDKLIRWKKGYARV